MADSLASKLSKIAAACSHVEKTGRNEFHRYSYATAADVLTKVNAALAAHNVCTTVTLELVSEHVGQTAKGATERLVTIKTTLTFHDGDSDQTYETEGFGSGSDTGDKAMMKACTASAKYAWMLALNISTGDDPEADEATDRRQAPPAARRPPAQQQRTPQPTATGAAPVAVTRSATTTPASNAQPAGMTKAQADAIRKLLGVDTEAEAIRWILESTEKKHPGEVSQTDAGRLIQHLGEQQRGSARAAS